MGGCLSELCVKLIRVLHGGGCGEAASCRSRDQLCIAYIRGLWLISPPLASKFWRTKTWKKKKQRRRIRRIVENIPERSRAGTNTCRRVRDRRTPITTVSRSTTLSRVETYTPCGVNKRHIVVMQREHLWVSEENGTYRNWIFVCYWIILLLRTWKYTVKIDNLWDIETVYIIQLYQSLVHPALFSY